MSNIKISTSIATAAVQASLGFTALTEQGKTAGTQVSPAFVSLANKYKATSVEVGSGLASLANTYKDAAAQVSPAFTSLANGYKSVSFESSPRLVSLVCTTKTDPNLIIEQYRSVSIKMAEAFQSVLQPKAVSIQNLTIKSALTHYKLAANDVVKSLEGVIKYFDGAVKTYEGAKIIDLRSEETNLDFKVFDTPTSLLAWQNRASTLHKSIYKEIDHVQPLIFQNKLRVDPKIITVGSFNIVEQWMLEAPDPDKIEDLFSLVEKHFEKLEKIKENVVLIANRIKSFKSSSYTRARLYQIEPIFRSLRHYLVNKFSIEKFSELVGSFFITKTLIFQCQTTQKIQPSTAYSR